MEAKTKRMGDADFAYLRMFVDGSDNAIEFRAEAERARASEKRLAEVLEGLIACINETRGPNAFAALDAARAALSEVE